jgi:branched-chain amino acid transport system permease protein/urea transport system permease protein
MSELLVTLLNALTLVSILMLVALGLAVIYGLLGVINMAHGEFVALGAYCLAFIHSMGGSFWWALLAAPVIGYSIGAAIEWGLVRHLKRDAVATILATWGLSLMLRQLIQIVFGAAPKPVVSPFDGAISIFGTNYPAYRLLLISMAGAVLAICLTFFYRTALGLDMRAIMQNRLMAESLGVDTQRVSLYAFGLGAGLAALAGVMLAPLTAVIPQMGINYLARSFLVVIVGGSGSVAGVAAGSTLIGGLETLFTYQLSPSIAQALVLFMAVVLLRYRPKGLMGGRRA